MHRSLYLKLLDTFRVNQQVHQFVGRAYGGPISNTETFVLVELDIDPKRSITELSGLLHLDKSTLSRALGGLEKKGFIKRKRAPRNQRKSEFEILAKGRKQLELHDETNRSQLLRFTSNVSIGELQELQVFFKLIADGAGAAEIVLRSGEDPLLLEVRRIARVLGATGPRVLDTDYSSFEWQILSEVKYRRNPTNSTLAGLFSLPPNTVSQALSRLEKRGLLRRIKNKGDKRISNLALTPSGDKALGNIEDMFQKLCRKLFKTLADSDLERGIQIFQKYIGMDKRLELGTIRPEITVAKISSESDLQEVRGMFLLEHVRSGSYRAAPSRIADPESRIYALRFGNRIAAAFEFHQQGKNWSAINFAHNLGAEERHLIDGFVRSSVEDLRSEAKSASLDLALAAPPNGFPVDLFE